MSAPQPAAKASAQSVLAAARRPVTRYRPAVIAAGVGSVLLLVALGFMIAFGGGHRSGRASGASPPPAQSQDTPSDLDRRLPASYSDPTASGLGSAQMPPPADAASGSPQPQPPSGSAAAEGPEQQRHAEAMRAARASSPLFAQGPSPFPPATTEAPPAMTAVAAPPTAVMAQTSSAKERFIAQAGSAQDYSPNLPQRPISAFEIKAGTLIPAALITGLDSDLPGPVVAQVTEPVFDHTTGRTVLIPQGARLIGKYDSQVAYGQDRALVVWTRIVFPDGRSLNIGAMVGADLTGAGGLADRVDTHTSALARAVGLSSLLSIGGAAAQNALTRGSDRLVLQDAAGGVSEAASQVGQRLVERDMQRAPTIHIRPGWPLRVLVDKDLVLEP